MPDLLIGAGNSRHRHLNPGRTEWRDLVTLDLDCNCKADIEWDLERLPYEWGKDNQFDEIHAYSVLEHTGRQGDWRFYFAQWSEFWRILKPGGFFCGIVPAHGSVWVWGDPGHSRHISLATLGFLDQNEYTKQVGVTPMCDYRHVYRGDFRIVHEYTKDDEFYFALQAVKPSRISIP